MKELYRKAILNVDSRVAYLLHATIRDKESPYCGIFRGETGLFECGSNTGYACHIVYAYLCPDSVYYNNEEVLDTLILYCDGMDKMINEDGTSNGAISNFHQPELFSVTEFSLAYRALMRKTPLSEKEKTAAEKMYSVILRLSRGLIVGGFHTPNHRWVLTGSLLTAYNTLRPEDKDPAMLEKANRFLAEKIDIDENGEYSERSVGMYSAVNDRFLCRIAIEANKPELFELVKRNLRLVYCFFERDTQFFTHNSRRSDKGEADGSRSFFYEVYADTCFRCYALTKDPFFLQFIAHLVDRTKEKEPPVQGLDIFFEFPELKELAIPAPVASEDFPESFALFQPENNILRVKKDGAIITVLADKYDFLYVTVGHITVSARMCSSFFAIAQFYSSVIEKTGESTYRLRLEVKADYKLPFENPPAHSEKYWTMDYKSRPVALVCRYGYTVDITLTEDGVSLHIATDGQEQVPFKLEFSVTPDVYVTAGSAQTIGRAGQFLCAKEGSISLCNYDGDEITLDGCFAKHFYHTSMRGSVPAPSNRFMVYMTDFSPVDRTVTIHCKKNKPWDYYG